MAVIDSRLLLSDKQSVTTSGDSTNTIDLGSQRHIGVGTPMYLVVQVTGAVSAALTASLETSNAAATGFTAIASVVIPTTAKVGDKYVIGLPMENSRYLRVKYAGSGQVTTYITDQAPGINRHYPAA